MLRRHSWLKPLSSSSSERPASGTWKTYCGCPAAKPSVGRRRAPAQRAPSVVATRSPTSSVASGGTSARRRARALGDGGLDGRGRPAAAHDRRAHLHAERARVGRCATIGPARPPRSSAAQSMHRPLGQVGQEPLHLRHLAQQHQAGADERRRRRRTSRGSRAPLALDRGPRRALQEATPTGRDARNAEVLGAADRADGERHGRRGSSARAGRSRSGSRLPSGPRHASRQPDSATPRVPKHTGASRSSRTIRPGGPPGPRSRS